MRICYIDFNLIWFNLDWFGLILLIFGLDWFRFVWFGFDWFDFDLIFIVMVPFAMLKEASIDDFSVVFLCAGPATHHRPVRGPPRWTQPHLPAGGPLWRDSGEFGIILVLVWLSLLSCYSTSFHFWSWWTYCFHLCMRNVSNRLRLCTLLTYSALVFWWWSFKTLISFLCFHLVTSLHCLVSFFHYFFVFFWVL